MSSIHNSKAPSRSSSNPAKAPPQSKKILIQQAPSLGSPGSSLATAGGTATINHPVQRPWPKAGSASPRPSRESSSQRMRHFRESRSPLRERRGPIAQQWEVRGLPPTSELRQPPHPPASRAPPSPALAGTEFPLSRQAKLRFAESKGRGVFLHLPGGDQRLLRRQVVLDEGLYDLVETAVGLDAERFGAAAVDADRPAGDDLLDDRVGLPLDAGDDGIAGDAAQRLDHLADARRDTGKLERAVVAENAARQIMRLFEGG